MSYIPKVTFTIRVGGCHQLWSLLINLFVSEPVLTSFMQQCAIAEKYHLTSLSLKFFPTVFHISHSS